MRLQVWEHRRILRGPGARKGSSASSVTIHGVIEVAKLLPRNGPSGTYSQR
jgi:hypothetical protein